MSKPPAFQYYTGDHFKDPQLSMCSLATRGVWFDFLCAMHECGRSGQVSGTVEQLSRIARCTTAEIRVALDELKLTRTAEVSERNEIVTVINRRMKREARERLMTNERVKKHRCNAPETEVKRECNTPSSSSSSPSDLSKPSYEGLEAKPPPKPKAKKPKKPRDERADHWAIQAILSLTGRWPKKVIWDEIITTLGDSPDLPRLTECFLAWAKAGRYEGNSTWFLDWFVNGIPSQGNGYKSHIRSVAEQNRINAEEAARRMEERLKNAS